MKKYEAMVIISANLDEAAREAALNGVQEVLKTNHSQNINVSYWKWPGDFAYEINKQTRGYYALITFETESDETVSEFTRLANINPTIVRHLVVRL